MYSVIFDKEAISLLNSLSQDMVERVFERIVMSKENPFKSFEKNKGRTDYKMRVGDYRVVADINMHDQRIEITYVSHRKDLSGNVWA